MKKFLLSIFFTFSAIGVFATHLAGGMITYECIGGGQYIIKLIRYKDATGNPLLGSYTIRMSPVNGDPPTDVTVTEVSSSTIAIVQTNPCHTPQYSLELEKHVYESQPVTIPSGSALDLYDMSAPNTIGDCCRNTTVDNINAPGTVGQVLYARIPDPGTYPCNSSPIFNGIPPIEVCLNDTIQFDHSATDPDGDELVYSLCDALEPGSYSPPAIPPFSAVPYLGGYTGSNPIAANPPLQIDPNTGFLTGYPTLPGQFVVNVCVEEYRNGVQIGHYAREIEMSVTNCTPNTQAGVETDSAASAGTIGIILECTDSTIDFTNQSQNAQLYKWDFGLPGNTDTSTAENPTFTYPAPGDYTVTLIANPNYWCADTVQALARIATKPDADFAYSTPLCTNQDITFTDQSTIDYGPFAFKYWKFSPINIKIGNSVKNSYSTPGAKDVTLIVNSTAGCADTMTKTIDVNKKPTISIDAPTNLICKGDTLPLNVLSPDNDIASYEWTNSTKISCDTCSSVLIYPNSPSAYLLKVTDTAGCTSFGQFNVNVSNPATIDAGTDTNLCSSGSIQLDASFNPSTWPPKFRWSPGNGLSDTTVLNPMAFPSQNTTYTLTLTNPWGYCKVTDTVFVRANPTTLSASASDNKICPGDTAYLQSNTNGTAVSYSWEPVNMVSDPNIPNPEGYLSADQIFTLTIYDTLSTCYSVDTVSVRINEPLGISAGADTSICETDQITLNASMGTGYEWFGDPSLSCNSCLSPTVAPTSTTTYYLQGLDANGCVNYDTVTVNVNPLPNLVTTSDTSICTNSSIQLQARGGDSYVWSPANSLSCDSCATPIASPSGNTTYNVTAYTSVGCQISSTVDVDLISLPSISTTPVNDICEGDSVQLSASGGITYSWIPATDITNPNVEDPKVFPSQSTTYSVIGYDANGCADTASVFVKVNSLGKLSFISDTSICENDDIQLYANGFVSYDWSPASSLNCTDCSNPIASPTTTTTYSVAVEDKNGCQDTGQVTITVNSLPIVSASAPKDSICLGSSTQLQATGGLTFNWTPSNGLSDPAIANPTASPNSSITYTVNVIDNNGCENTATLDLGVKPIPNTQAEADKEVCSGDTISISATGADSYLWTGPDIVDCNNCESAEVSPNFYSTYTVIGYLNNGCSTRDSMNVTVRPVPLDATTSADTNICQGDSAFLQVFGNSTYSYKWSPSTTLSCTNCEDPAAYPTTPTTYTVRVTNQFGCTVDSMVEVIVSSPATVEVTPDTGVCPGNSMMLEAGGGVSYNWSPPVEISGENSATPTITPSSPRTYNVEIIDALGCEIFDSVFVEIYEPADPMASDDTLVCIGSTVQLNASNGVQYNWMPDSSISDPTSENPLMNPTNTTTYTVEIVDTNGCINSDEVTVTVKQLPDVNAGPDQTIYENSTALINLSGAVSYSYYPTEDVIDSSANSVTVYPKDTTTYYVVGVDQFGCENSDTVTINVLELPRVDLPNAFSPNGDGKNDEYIIAHNRNFELQSLKIFNRWGQLVFETNDVNEGWNGRIIGEPQPIGVYVYTIVGVDRLGKTVKRQGNINLIR